MLLSCCKPIKHLLRYEEKRKFSLVHTTFTLEKLTDQPTNQHSMEEFTELSQWQQRHPD